MATDTLKSGSGNNLLFSNDDASAKIEVKEDGTNEITGSVSLANALQFAGGTGLSSLSADQWRLTSSFEVTDGNSAYLTANWSQVNSDGFGNLGAAIDINSTTGICTFPSTGYWLIMFTVSLKATYTMLTARNFIDTTVNAGSGDDYDAAAAGRMNFYAANSYADSTAIFLFDVTDVTTHNFKVSVSADNTVTVQGASVQNHTYITCIRLGDT